MKTFRSLLAAVLIALLAACAALPPQEGRRQTHALQNTEDTRLRGDFSPEERAHPGLSAFHLLPNAVDALVVRVVLTQMADRTLDLQYYIWHDDLTGRELAAALLKAADRGVRVRVLLDDLGTNADDRLLLALDAHPNVEIRLFNPVASRRFKTLASLLEFSRVNRRMHNKALIADNQGAILGGRNIGDEYFGASSVVAFGDLDVLVHGPIVRNVSNAFDEFWNSEAAYPIERLIGHPAEPAELAGYRAKLDQYVASMHDAPYVVQARERLSQVVQARDAEFFWGTATLLYDDPAKITRAPSEPQGHLITRFRALNVRPTREMLIVSAYFVPGESGVAWIRGLTENGVHVTVLTNSLAATDVAAAHAGYKRYRKDLLALGVRLYELRPLAPDGAPGKQTFVFGSSKASLHAKTYVFDRQSIFIGSMNLDPRSSNLNTEIGVLCDSEQVAGQVIDELQPKLDRIAWRVEQRADANGNARLVWMETEPDGTVVELDSEPGVSAWRRAGVWFLGLLPIESQL
ncbi:phospholipase D family protein [Paraburkholderia sp. SIMBA_030]|uniref:phospholipase D family protein n=1 Tax=Paraburkholderia sp. SIMBA_030 TaxID=3085773 RepID=UPI0039794AB2